MKSFSNFLEIVRLSARFRAVKCSWSPLSQSLALCWRYWIILRQGRVDSRLTRFRRGLSPTRVRPVQKGEEGSLNLASRPDL